MIVTFAAVDWVMTLDPHWFSTIWGLAFRRRLGTELFLLLSRRAGVPVDKAPMDRVLGRRHFHDLGKLMLALVMVWAYFNFSQYLIIWSGNIPEETVWFLARTTGGWGYIGVGTDPVPFAFPFLVLLTAGFQTTTRNADCGVAVFILLMRLARYVLAHRPVADVRTAGFEGREFLRELDGPCRLRSPSAEFGCGISSVSLRAGRLFPAMDPFFENAIEHGHGH